MEIQANISRKNGFPFQILNKKKIILKSELRSNSLQIEAYLIQNKM